MREFVDKHGQTHVILPYNTHSVCDGAWEEYDVGTAEEISASGYEVAPCMGCKKWIARLSRIVWPDNE